jgi:hypothetical protein
VVNGTLAEAHLLLSLRLGYKAFYWAAHAATMNHRMAIGANNNKVFQSGRRTVLRSVGKWFQVVHMCEVLSDSAVSLSEVKAASGNLALQSPVVIDKSSIDLFFFVVRLRDADAKCKACVVDPQSPEFQGRRSQLKRWG